MKSTSVFRFGVLAVGVMLVLGACRRADRTPPDAVQAHLRHGVLYASLEPDETDYFLYKGYPMGYHLELLQMFCREQGCRLVVRDGGSLREQMRMLETGETDILASNLNVSAAREEKLRFAHPFYTSRQVLVQLRKEYLHDSLLFVDSLAQLFGRSVAVRKNSVFEDWVHEINRRNHPRHIHAVVSEKTENELLNAVALGRIPYTVVSDNKAQRFALTHPQIDASVVLSEPQPVAWAVARGQDSLAALLDTWIDSLRESGALSYLYHKYYELPHRATVRSVEAGFRKVDSVNLKRRKNHFDRLVEEGMLEADDSAFMQKKHRVGKGERHTRLQISPYDKLFRKYAGQIDWDWHLLASLVYQESQFQSHLVSKKGAVGLMQMMPATARRYHITVRSGEEDQIKTGVRYIKSLYGFFPDSIAEPDRTRFVLASYNIGPGHVLDARRLAEKYGADANLWYGNVENWLLQLSKPKYYTDSVCRNGRAYGKQTVKFVKDIEERYLHYKNLVP
ncbi:MAG: transporter substrate-binding domain-containing protein [Bacteroidales bacterium]|nr:transporter substrate-binding domain-containing protein [Bacteroidales bacterium]